jgi:signal transduction histidine kinase
MQTLRVPVMSAERSQQRGAQELPQPITAIAALLVLVWALADGVWPSWPLWTIAGLLAVGLLARLADDRSVQTYAQPAAAFAALLVVSFALPDVRRSWPLSPLWIVALLLGLGLIARPLRQIVGGRPARESALPIAALAAVLVLLWTLSTDGYWFYTASPETVHSVDKLPVATLRIVADLLCLALVCAAPTGRRTVRGVISLAAPATALFLLVLTLASPPATGIRPAWPLWWAVAILAFVLGVDLLRWVASQPGAKVLAERVDELSRTRSGVLDVQATELRRIERDLHDGAQVRLVALSMKLGRAEDRYREDPTTAALLREAREDATAAIRELRELARGIAPPVLVNRGLDAAVRSLAQRSGVEVIVSSRLNRRPPPAVERAAYFVVAESLTNAAKHAPGARVEISLDASGHDLLVEITDFGAGGADPAGGGLTGLRQRVEALDGHLRVTSPAGVGTQVEAVMPCGR